MGYRIVLWTDAIQKLFYFINYAEADIYVKDVTKVNIVVRVGTTINKSINMNDVACYFPCVL